MNHITYIRLFISAWGSLSESWIEQPVELMLLELMYCWRIENGGTAMRIYCLTCIIRQRMNFWTTLLIFTEENGVEYALYPYHHNTSVASSGITRWSTCNSKWYISYMGWNRADDRRRAECPVPGNYIFDFRTGRVHRFELKSWHRRYPVASR